MSILRKSLLFCSTILVLLSPTIQAKVSALPSWSDKACAAWWDAHPTPELWREGRKVLFEQLVAAQEKHGLSKVFKNQHFLGWLELYVWLHQFPDSDDSAGDLGTAKGAAAYAAVGANKELREMFVQWLSPYDDAERAAAILSRCYMGFSEDVKKNPKLAVAISLVFDQDFPRRWPHIMVRRRELDIGDQDPATRFKWYLVHEEANRLMMNPRRLSVRELMFVVDTPLSFRELEHVQQMLKLKTVGRLKLVYNAINYDEGRANRGEFMWPHGSYRLFDIGIKGGVCADQAFYVSQAGKAKGIPTVLMIGQGQSGGHAWVGFMEQPGKWTDIARYRQENYTVGFGFDPQTWRRISDAQLNALLTGTGRGGGRKLGSLVLQWAKMNPTAPFYPSLLKVARKISPYSLEAWEMEEEWLVLRDPRDLDQEEAFWKAFAANFRHDPDLEFKGRRRLIRTLQKKGDASEAERVKKALVGDNASDRFDISISLDADDVLEQIERGKWDEARTHLLRLMKKYAKDKYAGHLFQHLVRPYIEAALSAGEIPKAREALIKMDTGFERSHLSVLESQINDLKHRMQAITE